jgi:thiamine-phosphate pyrophosphorylase
MHVNYSIYLVTDRDILAGRDLIDAVRQAIKGGVTLVQLREKNISSRDFFELAAALKKAVNGYNVPLIINDRLDIALAMDADGLHIGQDDLPLITARRLLGKDKILGYSVHNEEQAAYGEKNGADYLGAGTVYPTGSKADACAPIGTEMLSKIKNSVKISVVGIGGIGVTNAKAVKESGVDGISVISAILGKNDITGAANELASIWNG